ncbi:hypothetical protein JCM33774_89060 [Actinophytocola sp. KF-1]
MDAPAAVIRSASRCIAGEGVASRADRVESWRLRDLVAGRLRSWLGGGRLVVSDAHTGLKQAMASLALGGGLGTLPGALPRNMLAQVPTRLRRDGGTRERPQSW